MRIERHPDAAAFRDLVTPLLAEDEARFNLALGLVARIADGETFGPGEPVLLSAWDGETLAGMALMTPPHNLLASALPAGAAAAVDAYLAAGGPEPPGVLGSGDVVDAYAAVHTARTGRTARLKRRSGIYRLREVVPPRPVPGALRQVTRADLPTVFAWDRAFEAEVDSVPADDDRVAQRVDESLLWFWDDGGPRTLVGCGGYTPNGARIGPVYTPPEHRGRGYASAATAAVSDVLLRERGRSYCFLYTDLANPTSNKIYRAIGYEPVGEAREVVFGPASDG